jgi:glycosyltransferase involved in cell wall biosynthesis/predicted metal-dependent phosphoesterase TrpH
VSRCDLHVHSRFSTDSGNYALRRARLGESFTDPERLYRVCKARGMAYVTVTDHNTVEGALRIAELADTFVSVEVTTRFPEDEVPLHVLVWNLTEEDHADLQPLRPSVYELAAFLRERRLRHALAHPLYRMGPPLTVSHVERMMLLFGVWEGRNGARPREANELACRLAAAVTPEYLVKLAERHGFQAAHPGRIALTGGSDDHGALDIATTWTDAHGDDVGEFLESVCIGEGSVAGGHGSTRKLAHAVAALFANAYREAGGAMPAPLREQVERLFDTDAEDARARHEEIAATVAALAHSFADRARTGGVSLSGLAELGGRLGTLVLAGGLQAPYVATAHHHCSSRAGLAEIESTFFGPMKPPTSPYALVFTDTFVDANGVAGTMRHIAAAAAAGSFAGKVVAAGAGEPGVLALRSDWALALPGYETLELQFPLPIEVLELVEREQPSVVHVATPGPVGLCGLAAARLLGIPAVGSYHTELGPYALHLTNDLIVAQATELYVDWFYRQFRVVLAPTPSVADTLDDRGLEDVRIWDRGVDCDLFTPKRRRREPSDELVLLSVGRISREKRLPVLVDAFEHVRRVRSDVRLLVVGDGPARKKLERRAPAGVQFVGESRGAELADLYACADVFCFPSTTDTFGQVILEAGASGLPVVAAAAGGARDLVVHDQTGLLVPPDDASALARAILSLADDPAARQRLGRAAREAAEARTWERSLATLTAVYEELTYRADAPATPAMA